jgi:hypothetical protein
MDCGSRRQATTPACVFCFFGIFSSRAAQQQLVQPAGLGAARQAGKRIAEQDGQTLGLCHLLKRGSGPSDLSETASSSQAFVVGSQMSYLEQEMDPLHAAGRSTGEPPPAVEEEAA